VPQNYPSGFGRCCQRFSSFEINFYIFNILFDAVKEAVIDVEKNVLFEIKEEKSFLLLSEILFNEKPFSDVLNSFLN
jgi:hypothetical protein